MARSPRILLPSIVDPRDFVAGVGTATRGVLHALEAAPLGAEIELLALPRPGRAAHRARQLSSVARSLVSRLPAKALFAHSRRLRREARRRLQKRPFDLVLLNGADLLWLRADLPRRLPTILLAHNIEHELYRSQLDSLGSLPAALRRLLDRDRERLRRYELDGMREIGNVIFLSTEDAALACRALPSLRAITVPPLFSDPPPGRASRERHDGLLEIGMLASYAWWPNRQGLAWFLSEVFPHTGPDLRLHLFGEGSVDFGRSDPRVVAHGVVPRLEEVWSACDFMICPTHSGAGVSIKIAETLWSGVPVLATSFAVRGLSLEPDPGIVLLDGADDWVRFLRSGAARELGTRGVPRAVAEQFALGTHLARVHAFVREAWKLGPVARSPAPGVDGTAGVSRPGRAAHERARFTRG